MAKKPPTSQCPRCGKTVSWDDRFPERPFCSERCKLIDLGGWLTETHRIPGSDEDGDGVAERDD
ncbi:MAG: DNA gyrase inhibitor YacG [Gammaproteobacteria bacterium]|nr:DNA gyrase inhibitor YacG [Gammaproteobacteria bacterium]